MNIAIDIETWQLRTPFTISRRTCHNVDTLMVSLSKGGITGRGEAAGLNYKGETVASMHGAIELFFKTSRPNLTRADLLTLMPANGARCAVDCALWDLEAKTARRPLFDQYGITAAKTFTTAFTLSLDSPEKMAKVAKNAKKQPILKLKLGGLGAVERVMAVRHVRPDATIIVDANEALTFDELKIISPQLKNAGVALIEQPVPRNTDAALLGYKSPVPLCADESCMTHDDLPNIVGKYDIINIKLEKCGGLTEALILADAAKAHGLTLMVGCMLGTSLAMAPAMIIAAQCTYIDLDGPLLLAADRPNGIVFDAGKMAIPSPLLWG